MNSSRHTETANDSLAGLLFRLFVCSLVNLLLTSVHGQSNSFEWVAQAGGANYESSSGIAVDDAGNCIVVGSFESSCIFGGTNLISAGRSDVFIAKYTPVGNLEWVRSAGGGGTIRLTGLLSTAPGIVTSPASFQLSLLLDPRA